MIPGLVSEVEERDAAIANGYTWREWGDLSRNERIHNVAHYRLRRLIDAHVEDAVSAAGEARMRRARARG